jgi:hypothetical protein
MANRYWVIDSGNWNADDTTHWSDTDGGDGGFSVPTSSDNVIFNANSGAGSYSVTVAADVSCLNIDFTNPISGVLTFDPSGNRTMHVYGNFTIHSNITFVSTGPSLVMFESNSLGNTITTNGITLSAIYFNGTGGWTLQDNITTNYSSSPSFRVEHGTFNSGNKNITCTGFVSNNTFTRSITLGTSTITTNLAYGWDTTQTTGLIFSGTSSIISLTSNNSAFFGGGLTYGEVDFNGAGTNNVVTGSNTIATLNASVVAKTIKFAAGTTQTIGKWGISGDATHTITITSDTTGTHTLTKSGGGLISADYLNIQHSIATPTNNWFAGTHSTNNQGTTTAGNGWVFSIPGMVLDAGSFSLTGQNTTMSHVRHLIASVGAFVLTGQSILKSLTKHLVADVQHYLLTGIDISMTHAKTLVTNVGSFVLSGINVGINTARNMVLNAGNFILTGENINILAINVPKLTFRNNIAPYNLLDSISFIQSSPSGSILPVLQGATSNEVKFRIYNNFNLSNGIHTAVNVSLSTFDDATGATANKSVCSQQWIKLYQTGFGQSSVTPGAFTYWKSDYKAVGGNTNTFSPDKSSGGALSSQIAAGSDQNGCGFIEVTAYAEVPNNAGFQDNSFALIINYEYI